MAQCMAVQPTPLLNRASAWFVFRVQKNTRRLAGIKHEGIDVFKEVFIAWPTVGDGGSDAGILVEALGQKFALVEVHVRAKRVVQFVADQQ